jgi:hypothetical protein
MVHGSFDPHAGRMIYDGLRRFWPQLEVCELERCGHYPSVERHAAKPFLQMIVRWRGWQNAADTPGAFYNLRREG